MSIRMLPSSYFSSRLQIASRCWYFSLVAIPPRIWRSDLLGGKRWIDRDKSLRAVLMHCTLAYPKSFCSLAYRSVVIYNVISNGHSPFFNIIFQRKTPQNTFVQSMKVSEGLCIEIVSVLNHMRFGKFFSLLE